MKYQVWDENNEGGKWIYVYKVDANGLRTCIKAIQYYTEKNDESDRLREDAVGEALQFIDIQKKTQYSKEMIYEV